MGTRLLGVKTGNFLRAPWLGLTIHVLRPGKTARAKPDQTRAEPPVSRVGPRPLGSKIGFAHSRQILKTRRPKKAAFGEKGKEQVPRVSV